MHHVYTVCHWEGGERCSAVHSACCSHRGHEFGSQHLGQMPSQQEVTPVPGDPMPLCSWEGKKIGGWTLLDRASHWWPSKIVLGSWLLALSLCFLTTVKWEVFSCFPDLSMMSCFTTGLKQQKWPFLVSINYFWCFVTAVENWLTQLVRLQSDLLHKLLDF